MPATIWFGILLAAICLLSGWMFVSSRFHYLVKIVAATLIVLMSIYAWDSVVAVLGYPIHDIPPDNSVIGAVIFDKPHDLIYLWINGDKPRAYEIPYIQTTADAIAKAEMKAAMTGGLVIFHRNGKQKHGNPGQRGDGTGINDQKPSTVTIDVVPTMPSKD